MDRRSFPLQEWPELPLDAWQDTYATLHRWSQVVGKIRLALTPMTNHWWNSALHTGARGLTTLAMPCGDRDLELELDFVDHNLCVRLSSGQVRYVPLIPRSVATFYLEVMNTLRALGLEVQINPKPQEIPGAVPFDQDTEHASYDAEAVGRWWRALLSASAVLHEFRGRFRGKCSPVHFFWGSFDLAVSRFSGRPAPPRAGADLITREAYSDEVSSAGFWPGGGEVRGAAFYSYFAPAPRGLAEAHVEPAAAFFHPKLSEFLLPYDDVRKDASPRSLVLDFLQSTYEAGADLAGWDRQALERHGDEAAAAQPGVQPLVSTEPIVEPPGTGGPQAEGP